MTDTAESDVRHDVSIASRILAEHNHGDYIWGHVSVRDQDGRGFWLKPSGLGMDEVTPDVVHLVDFDGNVVLGEGSRHFEFPIHAEIMRARPDVGAVVHSHAPHAVALGASGMPLRPVSHAANLFSPPDVPRFTVTGDLIRTAALGRQLADCLGDAPAAFLVNHGIVAVGADVEIATCAALLLEDACRLQLLTASLPGWPTWSDPVESLQKRDHAYPDHALRAMWRYLVRRQTRREQHAFETLDAR